MWETYFTSSSGIAPTPLAAPVRTGSSARWPWPGSRGLGRTHRSGGNRSGRAGGKLRGFLTDIVLHSEMLNNATNLVNLNTHIA